MTGLKQIAPRVSRNHRAPLFPLGGTLMPYGLYPVYAFPVLTGETVNRIGTRGRWISQPLASPIAGAWMEGWVFEVPMRLIGTSFVNDLAPSLTGHVAASASSRFFTNAGQFDLIQSCYDQVVADYFTKPGLTVPEVETGIAQLPLVSADWMDNIQPLPAGFDTATMPEAGFDTPLTGMALDDERALTETEDYRQFVQMFGVTDPESQQRSRIRRYFRQWGIPNNVIDPATGVPRSSHFFDLNWSLGKGFRAKEPAVILVMMAWRPQMTKTLAQGSYLGRMAGLKEWFPPQGRGAWSIINGDDPIFPASYDTSATAADYIFDRSDVFMKGEPFINAATADNPYPPPTSSAGDFTDIQTLRGTYASSAERDALFVGTGATDKLMYYQGIGSARLTGLVREVAP